MKLRADKAHAPLSIRLEAARQEGADRAVGRALRRAQENMLLACAVTPAAPAHPLEVDFDEAIHSPPEPACCGM